MMKSLEPRVRITKTVNEEEYRNLSEQFFRAIKLKVDL